MNKIKASPADNLKKDENVKIHELVIGVGVALLIFIAIFGLTTLVKLVMWSIVLSLLVFAAYTAIKTRNSSTNQQGGWALVGGLLFAAVFIWLFIPSSKQSTTSSQPLSVASTSIPAAQTNSDSVQDKSIPRIDSPTSNQSPSPQSRTLTNGDNVSFFPPEVEQVFAARLADYEKQLMVWKQAIQDKSFNEEKLVRTKNLQQEFQQAKPSPTTFEERTWTTQDFRHTSIATFISTNGTTSQLKKSDGKIANVRNDALSPTDQFYIEQAAKDQKQFDEEHANWLQRNATFETDVSELTELVKLADSQQPQPPNKTDVSKEIADQKLRKQREEQLALEAELKKKKAEEAAMAAEAAQRRAEEDERNAQEKSRLQELEHHNDGLVLLKKSVKATVGPYGGTITGYVENRRNRKVSYVEITYLLYDANGSQVGTAMTNIIDLEAGGRWKFEAIFTEEGVKTYRFNELKGR